MTRRQGRAWAVALAATLVFSGGGAARAQLPGLPGAAAPASKKDAGKPAEKPAPTKDNPQATVAAASGPIQVQATVPDETIEGTLERLLPKYPGVRNVTVNVDEGVVTLEGQVEGDDTRDDVTQFTRRVEGVRLVLNRMKTDSQVLTGTERARDVLGDILGAVERNWLVVIVAVALVLLFSALARVFNAYAETLLAPFVRNVMLRSIVGSLVGSGLVVCGILSALSILNLTRVVLSVLGLAGVVGLAVGFAFRDIAENFIASVLLGVRRPFLVGDYITLANHSGVVKSLNTRATVLVTLEGNHVRIPNSVVYKEVLVNSSASPSSRGNFELVVPYEASTDAALQAVTRAVRGLEGVLADPPARALVQALEPSGVRIRAFYWAPVKGIDGDKLASDAKLRAKVALQEAGVVPSPPALALTVVGRVPVELAGAAPAAANGRAGAPAAHPPAPAPVTPVPPVAPAQAEANLRRDARAADRATAAPADGRPTPMEHVLHEAETHVSEEGTNLLAGAKSGEGRH